MKSLLLIRHAKSSWAAANLKDFDRPLNERGNADAPKMARRLMDRNYTIDLFVSSPAQRAAATALYFANEYQKTKSNILFIPSLYLASAKTFFNVIETIDDRFKNIALVSHNNGITDFANLLTDVQIDNMPTCSVFAVKIHADNWKEIKSAKIEFDFFDKPGLHKNH